MTYERTERGRIQLDKGKSGSETPEKAMSIPLQPESESRTGASCPPTRNTLVARACGDDPMVAEAALRELCGYYQGAFARFANRMALKWRLREQDAEDLPGGFIEHLLRKPLRYERRPGKRFRDFLRTSFSNYTVDQVRKRGPLGPGSRPVEPWDEGQSTEVSVDDVACFDGLYARALVEAILAALRAEYESKNQGQVFLELKRKLTGRPDAEFYNASGARLGQSAGAVKTALHRMRHRFGELFREEVAQTVAPEDVEDEIRHLFKALASRCGTAIA